MHVSGFSLDLNWFLQFIFTSFVVALGLLHLVKNTASKYFVVDANFEGGRGGGGGEGGGAGAGDVSVPGGGRSDPSIMPGVSGTGDSCLVCGNLGTKKCSGCKAVRYCSQTCQATHWKSGHKTKCKDFQLSGKANLADSTTHSGRKASGVGVNNSNGIALVPSSGTSKILKQSKEILFPYDEFVEFFNWDKPGFPPCGLINCGNSCFANVVLQCLAYTRPLVAYLLEKGHQKQCRRNDRCFLCEFQVHVERASHSPHPFSPINILSRLPSIGGNLGYGKQEDAHEFMRFAIDTMQSVCLDEFGGEKAVHPSSQETTLIQHIFGGHLQSQVICTKCSKISNQYENMMDLTVEIHGDAASLEECLDQFTVTEWLHGENMYKCDGCNDYVKASKRLTVRHAPNILTIALKRFQVTRVELDDVLSQGAYMLLYSRVCVRSSCLKTTEPFEKENEQMVEVAREVEPCSKQPVECFTKAEKSNHVERSRFLPSDSNACSKVSNCEELSFRTNYEIVRKDPEDVDMINPELCSPVSRDTEVVNNGHSNPEEIAVLVDHTPRMVSGFASSSEISSTEVHYPKCKSVSSSDVEEGGRAKSTCVDEVMSLASSIENSVPTQNGACGRAETSHEVSAAPRSTVKETLDETKPVSSEGLAISFVDNLERNKWGKDLPSSSCCTDHGGGKLTGQNSSSDTKLKPLFSPGFLGKRPRNKSTKRDGKASEECHEVATAGKVSSNCNGIAKPGFPHQRSGELNNEAQALSNYNNLPSSSFVGEQPQKSLNEDEMVSIEFSESVIPCEEDGNFVTANESSNNITMGGAEESKGRNKDCSINSGSICSLGNPLAEKLLAIDGEVHERGAITHSGLMGTKSKDLAERGL
ncbi:ubiquitin carboxyl-terminal hydrolase 18-like isoform X2 [Vitis riparia]|uniref:ubiquitin carboxyl-terminal hydrolase 18-like isoform X2 n=1 Tax=Vitis riparia TaxID=96939 RepID=UPI00155AD6EA|nr:ubiquitin carboxyl-terminal hydrolase 18-like isoform X2 [Vitis riparia]